MFEKIQGWKKRALACRRWRSPTLGFGSRQPATPGVTFRLGVSTQEFEAAMKKVVLAMRAADARLRDLLLWDDWEWEDC